MSVPGDRITYNGQAYICVKIAEYTGAGGFSAPYSIWEAKCAVPGCPIIFEQHFPPDFPRKSVKLNRRCAIHRRPGVRVAGEPKHPPNKTSVLAAAWLQGYADRTLDLQPTTRFIINAVTLEYHLMPPGVAVALGSNASNAKERYDLVFKRLKLAVRLGFMRQVRGRKGSQWERVAPVA
jgi:hypothetical protein